MSIGTTAAIAIGVGSAAAGIGSAAIGAHAAGNAAKAQKDSAVYAADLQKQEADNSLAFQKQVYGDQKTNLAPYIAQGQQSLAQLGAGMQPGGQFTKTFNTSDMASLDPGFDFRMQQGQLALNRAEAAGGNIGSGGALKAALQYGQDYASGEFNNAYNRFMNTQNTQYNRLASLAGLGQTANQQAIGAGNQAAGNIANIDQNYANNAGNAYMQAGNATASGYMGAANAWGSGINGIGNNIMGLYTLSQLPTILGKKG
jgi:hypothetical protein